MIIKRNFDYYGSNRPLHIYLPEDYYQTSERYPVMYFFDGHNLFYDSDATYGKSWGLKTFLDGWNKKMIIVGMECSHVGNERLEEYLPYPATTTAFGPLAVKGNETLEWIVNQVKPMIDRDYRTYPNRQCTGIAGSSMGGLMSIRGVLAYNRVFSKAACVSSASGFCPESVMADVYGTPVDPDTRVYLSWGSKEAWGRHDPDREDPRSPSYRWNHAIARQVEICGGAAWAYCQPGGGHCEADWEKLVPDFMDFLWMR